MTIDYGERRIGIAVSDSGVVATPHSAVRNEGAVACWPHSPSPGRRLAARELAMQTTTMNDHMRQYFCGSSTDQTIEINVNVCIQFSKSFHLVTSQMQHHAGPPIPNLGGPVARQCLTRRH